MIYPKIPLAQTLVSLCKSKGIKHIVISPGSRNAPLTIGFTNDSFFKCYSIIDERCAAFFALGIAQQLQEPTAVVCTSGSALLNYYPAVAEAYYSNIPLVVLSADRPKNLIDVGDGQTINQKNVFDSHTLFSTDLKLDLKDEKHIHSNEDVPVLVKVEDRFERLLGLQKNIQSYNEEEINMALNMALMKKGPVHINIPFDEPLYDVVEKESVKPKIIEAVAKPHDIEDYVLQTCLEQWDVSPKKMILVGANMPNQIEMKWLDELAEDDSIIVLTESTSNIHHSGFFPSIDQLIDGLSTEEKEALQPDILVTFGGLIVSKKVKQFLRNYQPKHHWHIDRKRAYDTFFCLDNHIEATPNTFFESFLPKILHYVKSHYKTHWLDVKAKRLKKHKDYIKNIPFSDLKVFNRVLKSIPDDSILQVGNSSAIRYTQLFKVNKTLEVYCNRGTSGIDGCTSTAIGCAVAREDKPTVLLTGDLSFLYDSNALWNNHIPSNFRIIVVNNQGGGIFRILPGHKDTENFDTYFETNHNLTAEHLCKMYGLDYQSVDNEEALASSLTSFYADANQPKLLEIFTPKKVNDDVLLKYFEHLKETPKKKVDSDEAEN
ncbi:2-succinyl-5-enolpyruvyl-6-hydroxy-3-cyclohexene-1-carboxylate synthase [Tamlana sp. s12]|uniref:2-succinyl-5-enolpyruvyl-6-hydroxy-3- cyclohexene-1-carboxylate synthase n=1 Tax=Tamlana sp. s12 TaxID=1630406 RepID=UPI0007FBAC0C|nr:2-succinyl-5-enolpyruvyl-6-hydroxy-3-cyclohexene-1-carboxylate synthase [Tamlana sp. s12]OBQ56593.1 2-succinyl-5-enolpyruvyl-6-hydroxy-3-cyclohexene-1-carboxylate synthase [Tamlana sp. s12]QQY81770.1 2-succinyl-5-enolpyruvyl-6-hydroxy-3-cyclohexene-1-carboxylate synthase [Tamlana sp. s12]